MQTTRTNQRPLGDRLRMPEDLRTRLRKLLRGAGARSVRRLPDALPRRVRRLQGGG